MGEMFLKGREKTRNGRNEKKKREGKLEMGEMKKRREKENKKWEK